MNTAFSSPDKGRIKEGFKYIDCFVVVKNPPSLKANDGLFLLRQK